MHRSRPGGIAFGRRKVWARLRISHPGCPQRVLRLMRENNPRPIAGRVAAYPTVRSFIGGHRWCSGVHGRRLGCWIFTAVELGTSSELGWHVCRRRPLAPEPIAMGLAGLYGSIAPALPRAGLADGSRLPVSDHAQPVTFHPAPTLRRRPQTNRPAVSESDWFKYWRFFRAVQGENISSTSCG